MCCAQCCACHSVASSAVSPCCVVSASFCSSLAECWLIAACTLLCLAAALCMCCVCAFTYSMAAVCQFSSTCLSLASVHLHLCICLSLRLCILAGCLVVGSLPLPLLGWGCLHSAVSQLHLSPVLFVVVTLWCDRPSPWPCP